MKFCPKCGDNHSKLGRFCSRKCSNSRNWSEEDKLKKSISAKNSKKVKIANQIPRKRRVGKQNVISICLHCNKEIIAKRVRKYHKECWDKCSGGLREGSTKVHRQEYKGIMLDSGAEKGFVMFLENNNVKWVKNKKIFFYYLDNNNKKRKYYPDFYLPEYKQWVEIKGKFYADKDPCLKLKLKSVKGIKIIYSNMLSKLKLSDVITESVA